MKKPLYEWGQVEFICAGGAQGQRWVCVFCLLYKLNLPLWMLLALNEMIHGGNTKERQKGGMRSYTKH